MSNSDNFQDTLVALLLEENNNLTNLAHLAGADPKTFYRTANFRNADLLSERLNDFDLSSASFNRPPEFVDSQRMGEEVPFVRMSAVVLTVLHELLSKSNKRQLSAHLERLLWRNRTRFAEYIRSVHENEIASLEINVYKKISNLGVQYPKSRHRAAYTFSKSLRDEIYRLSEQLGQSSGPTLEVFIYWCFLHDQLVQVTPGAVEEVNIAWRKVEYMRQAIEERD